MSLADVITQKKKMGIENIEFVVNVNTAKDYMLLNYLEQEISKQQGPHFFTNSSDKIQFIMGFILNEDFNGIYDMYSGSYDIYMNTCGNDINYVNGFNIVFLVLIHIAMKIIRKNKTGLEA